MLTPRASVLFELHQAWTPFAERPGSLLAPLVALNLLAVRDAEQTGDQDSLVLLADEAARCLAGKAPLRRRTFAPRLAGRCP